MRGRGLPVCGSEDSCEEGKGGGGKGMDVRVIQTYPGLSPPVCGASLSHWVACTGGRPPRSSSRAAQGCRSRVPSGRSSPSRSHGPIAGRGRGARAQHHEGKKQSSTIGRLLLFVYDTCAQGAREAGEGQGGE